MSRRGPIARQRRSRTLGPVLAMTYAPPLLWLTLLVGMAPVANFSLEELMRDPAATAEVSPFLGLSSNVGVLLWTSAAAVCLFTAGVLRRADDRHELRHFLLWAGLLAVVLTVDDFFMFHETVARHQLGIDEDVVLVSYAALLLWWLVRFRKVISGSEPVLFAIMVAFFGLSLAVDLLQSFIEPAIGSARILLEDGGKFLGIVGWLSYFSRTCLRAVAPRPGVQPSSVPQVGDATADAGRL